MPCFFFHTDDGRDAYVNECGTDLSTVEAVPREVVSLLCELVVREAPLDAQTIVATVCDADGAIVLRTKLTVSCEFHAP